MNVLPLIEAKREGRTLSSEQIREIIAAYARGAVPDYQMAALLMAIFFRGLDATETRALTFAMRDSGDALSFPKDPSRPVVDKHSTGGIGDKVSLPLAPLLACLGFRVPMISGRGLGITGGTLDKLDSIPGFRSRLTAAEIVKQVEEVGCVICGQTEAMCPADRLLYALRDATGTVPSIPLITSSILSKKLCEGIEALVLDVKFGGAAFMPTQEQARELARTMVQIAAESGVKTRALLTDMNAPIGRAAGNWLEVKESIGCLEGRGPADLRELVVECAAHLLALTGKSPDVESARALAAHTLASGAPRRKWDEMLLAQGADMAALGKKLNERVAPATIEVRSKQEGFVSRCDARILGEVIRDLGGGRLTRESRINHDVGIDGIAVTGTRVNAGDALCHVHLADVSFSQADEVTERVGQAFELSAAPPPAVPRIVEVL